MDKSSYMSCSNYFDKLRCKTRKFDEDVDRLSETWKTPYLLVGGYADCTAETTVYLEELWESIRSTNDAAEKFQSELESSLKKTDEFLVDLKAVYDDLKEQCDNVDSVLAEYGYHYEDGDSSQENNRNDSKDQTNNSILTNEEMSDVEIEFTPNLTWKGKAKSFTKSDFPDISQRNSAIKGIATPVIKSLASVRQLEMSTQKDH